MDVDEIVRQFLQGAEIRQLLLRACAKEQHQATAFKLAALAQATPPLGHSAHGRTTRAGANHDDVGARMVGHQERGAKRANDLHLVTGVQIAEVIGADPQHRLALVVFLDPLHRERQIVVTRPLAIARAGDGVLARMVRLALRIHTRRDDANRLTFQHRERHGAQVKHDVMGFVFRARLVHLHIAHHGGRHRRLGAVQIGVRVCRRPGRHRGTPTA